MAGPTAAETTKMAEGGPGPLTDLARQHKAKGQTIIGLSNTQLKESGAGFWADMARQGGQVVSP
jgi:hypothetical protein